MGTWAERICNFLTVTGALNSFPSYFFCGEIALNCTTPYSFINDMFNRPRDGFDLDETKEVII